MTISQPSSFLPLIPPTNQATYHVWTNGTVLPEGQQQQSWNVSEGVDGGHFVTSATWPAETQS